MDLVLYKNALSEFCPQEGLEHIGCENNIDLDDLKKREKGAFRFTMDEHRLCKQKILRLIEEELWEVVQNI